eukprot:EG_transcript_25078
MPKKIPGCVLSRIYVLLRSLNDAVFPSGSTSERMSRTLQYHGTAEDLTEEVVRERILPTRDLSGRALWIWAAGPGCLPSQPDLPPNKIPLSVLLFDLRQFPVLDFLSLW